jgi:L-lactate dehydrogenase
MIIAPSLAAARPARVAVIGAGHVGATFAYTLELSGLAAEIVLVDVDRGRAVGEAMDLGHAVPFSHPTRIWAGDYGDCAGAVVTVVAAGANQKPGETRLDLVRRNATVFADVVPRVVKANPDGLILTATNPVDVLAYEAWQLSGLPPERVIGSGTILDTARFRYLLGQHLGVDPRSVHAFIAGEHGDSEVPLWSSANVAGVRLEPYCAAQGTHFDHATRDQLFVGTRDAAYAIINSKGATYYAVAAGLARIVEAILRDQHTVLSVSNLVRGAYGIQDVYLSLPAVVARRGVERVLQLELSPEEQAGLRRSAEVLRSTIDAVRELWTPRAV